MNLFFFKPGPCSSIRASTEEREERSYVMCADLSYYYDLPKCAQNVRVGKPSVWHIYQKVKVPTKHFFPPEAEKRQKIFFNAMQCVRMLIRNLVFIHRVTYRKMREIKSSRAM